MVHRITNLMSENSVQGQIGTPLNEANWLSQEMNIVL